MSTGGRRRSDERAGRGEREVEWCGRFKSSASDVMCYMLVQARRANRNEPARDVLGLELTRLTQRAR